LYWMSDIFEEGACTEWRISTTVPDGLRMEQVGRGRPLVAESHHSDWWLLAF